MSGPNPKVDAYLEKSKAWQEEMARLREILLDCGLDEELKWRQPCYTFDKNNVAIIQPFKKSCALMFFKGALLKDPEGVLERPGENSRAARRIRFTNVQEIDEIESALKSYIKDAMKVEKAGLKVEAEESDDLEIPAELQEKFNEVPELEEAFYSLTPGRQRGYVLHFSSAKQSKTRTSRIEKCMQKIFDGKGFNER